MFGEPWFFSPSFSHPVRSAALTAQETRNTDYVIILQKHDSHGKKSSSIIGQREVKRGQGFGWVRALTPDFVALI